MLCSVNGEKPLKDENTQPPLSLLDLEVKEPTTTTNNTISSSKQSHMNVDNSLAHFSSISEDKPPVHGKQDSKRNKLKSASVMSGIGKSNAQYTTSPADKSKVGEKT